MIRIRSDKPTGQGATVTTEDGQPIKGITAMQITLSPHGATIAELSIRVAGVDIAAHPLLSRATVEAAALHYGLIDKPKRSLVEEWKAKKAKEEAERARLPGGAE